MGAACPPISTDLEAPPSSWCFDLNLAARYADHLIALNGGTVRALGTPAEVLTEEVVSDFFSMESRVIVDPTSGKPLMLPLARHHRTT